LQKELLDRRFDKRRLIHQSFRIEEGVIESLQKEANRKGVPSSHLVNKILKNYITSDRYFQELGFILVSKDLTRKFLDKLEEGYLIEQGRQFGSKIAKEYIPYFFADVNSYTLLEFLELWFSRFSFQHRIDYRHHSYSINHELGKSYSIFFKEYISVLVGSIIKSSVQFSIVSENAVTFSFDLI
jgi:hypothetical protein